MGRVKAGIFGTVYVLDDDGARHAFVAGDEVPAWAEGRMVDVLESGASTTPTHEWKPETSTAWTDIAETANADASSEDPAAKPEKPPKAGAGSGLDAWLEYATAIGVDVADDATRSDVIAAVEAAEGH